MGKYLKKAAADWDKKKVLTLVVSKQWFDIIAAGRKTEEYREIKPYWVRRILDMSRAKVGADTILWLCNTTSPETENTFLKSMAKY